MNITHGKSIEITDLLSARAAQAFAKWIGCANVIRNQKTIASNEQYDMWVNAGKPKDNIPEVNGQVSYLTSELSFLKEVPCQIRRSAGAKWVQAVNAAKQGLVKKPVVRSKSKKRSCYVTNELFDVEALDENRCVIHIKQDAKKTSRGNYLIGIAMPFPKKDAGKALYLSRKGRRFWLSMSFSLEKNILPEKEIKAILTDMTNSELENVLVGYDLGVTRQVTSSDRQVYHLPDDAKTAINKLEKRRVRYQRRYARIARANDRQVRSAKDKEVQATAEQKDIKRNRTKGELKMSAKVSKYGEKIAHIKHYNSHVISKQIAENTPICAVFEDLKLTNMVRRPKPKLCEETGMWLVNGAKAKSGLNKAILGANLGQIRQFTRYKLAEQSKLMIVIKPYYSSQECAKCEHTEKANRPSQSVFSCVKCRHHANADENAAKVLKKRGIKHIRSDTFSKEKTVRKISARRVTKVTKAHELASTGSGESVSLASQANFDEALNSGRTNSYDI